MNGQEFVLILIGVVMCASVLRAAVQGHYQTRERRRREQTEDAETQKTQEQLAALEERIRVLERIVTDERYELRQRFRDL
ncbi:MAG TPA: hypothetical protein VFY39_17475 [Gammaproteobacteria bacterium]|nr:hypothetical protein [Gammaproteobacteria bacterium]